MSKESISVRKFPAKNVVHALEQTLDYLRADYLAGVETFDLVEDCFQPLFDGLELYPGANQTVRDELKTAISKRLGG